MKHTAKMNLEYDDCPVNTSYSEQELIEILEANGYETEMQSGVLFVRVQMNDWKGNDCSELFNAVHFYCDNKDHLIH